MISRSLFFLNIILLLSFKAQASEENAEGADHEEMILERSRTHTKDRKPTRAENALKGAISRGDKVAINSILSHAPKTLRDQIRTGSLRIHGLSFLEIPIGNNRSDVVRLLVEQYQAPVTAETIAVAERCQASQIAVYLRTRLK